MINKDYCGLKWYKCDFHLHTPESECFTDKTITPEQWIEKVKESGLDCIAITDHNTGKYIDKIKGLAEAEGIVIFPGVEVTCGDAKVHILVLFDINCNSNKINHFLIKLDIDYENFAKPSAHTIKSIKEVAEIANKLGGIVIPAHIDEFNGISQASFDIRKDFLQLDYISAVQVVNRELAVSSETINKEAFKTSLYNTYGKEFSDEAVKDFITCTKQALDVNKALLTFSDNPENESSSKHGVWGIGQKYTWIKMNSSPNLNSLRQALLLNQLRVKNCFESPYKPYKLPSLWIKGIKFNNSEVTEGDKLASINFSPQMTTIIGGRGSGKSSIIKFIKGVMKNTSDVKELNESLREFNDFFKLYDNKQQIGVLRKDTYIELEVVRNDLLYKIVATDFTKDNHKLSIEKLNEETGVYEPVDDEGFSEFFKFDVYTQKQIYELAKKPNILREKIDYSLDEVNILKNQYETKKKEYLGQYMKIKRINDRLKFKNKLETELKDISHQLTLFNESGIQDKIKCYQAFQKEQSYLSGYGDKVLNNIESLNNILTSIIMPELDIDSNIREEYKIEIEEITDKITRTYNETIENIKLSINNYYESMKLIKRVVENSVWLSQKSETNIDFQSTISKLRNDGIEVEGINLMLQKHDVKQQELSEINKLDSELIKEKETLDIIKKDYIDYKEQTHKVRKDFLKDLLKQTTIKMEVSKFRDINDFEHKLRAVLQKDIGFDEDIKTICDMCFSGDIVKNINNLYDEFNSIKAEEPIERYTGKFKNVIKALNDEQMAEISLLIPEDNIIVKYQPSGNTEYKSLSNASAGQKTSAILTFILSHGDIPLVLDQPEDDLDNHLIYDLIVERLKISKEQRQIIVVTHNANIPVNGDAEHVVAMNSESKYIEVYTEGCIEDYEIKDEICTVMEGGEDAFIMRSKRYGIA